MSRYTRSVQLMGILMVFTAFGSAGQTLGQDEIVYQESDVVWPKLALKEQPTYPDEAAQAGIQGDVLIAVTIGTNGIPRDPIILSPLGNGINERALDCLSTWRFSPATRNGIPVNFRGVIQMSFRIAGRTFDSRAENKRVGTIAVMTLLSRQENGRVSHDSIGVMRSLAESSAQAEYQVGLWQIQGTLLPKDDMTGLKRIQHAANKRFPPAMVFIGDALDGRGMRADKRKGLTLLRKAAAAGSVDAKRDLGRRYMDGRGLKPDLREARKYLELCSQAGALDCEKLSQPK